MRHSESWPSRGEGERRGKREGVKEREEGVGERGAKREGVKEGEEGRGERGGKRG